MAELPEQAVQRATRALIISVDVDTSYEETARFAVEAAAPILAEYIAEAITKSVCDPNPDCANRRCPDCIRYMQCQTDALIAREALGGGHG